MSPGLASGAEITGGAAITGGRGRDHRRVPRSSATRGANGHDKQSHVGGAAEAQG
jgi:hypothetical protein